MEIKTIRGPVKIMKTKRFSNTQTPDSAGEIGGV
jgi:hypothetical protein